MGLFDDSQNLLYYYPASLWCKMYPIPTYKFQRQAQYRNMSIQMNFAGVWSTKHETRTSLCLPHFSAGILKAKLTSSKQFPSYQLAVLQSRDQQPSGSSHGTPLNMLLSISGRTRLFEPYPFYLWFKKHDPHSIMLG